MLLFSVLTDIIITFILVFSLSLAHKSRKQINEYKYRIYSPYTKFIVVALILLLLGLYELITSYLATRSTISLLDAYANLGLLVLLGFYISCKNYICDSGLWAWGALRKWSDIQSFSFTDEGRSLVFQTNDHSFLSKYRSKFRIGQEEKQELITYIKSHLKKKK